MNKLIENTAARNEVLAAFDKAMTIKAGRRGAAMPVKAAFEPGRDEKVLVRMIMGSQIKIVESPASAIRSASGSLLRREPAMVRFYGASGILVHEELAQ